jgi:geranylgeranyl pyrophosphate synthase
MIFCIFIIVGFDSIPALESVVPADIMNVFNQIGQIDNTYDTVLLYEISYQNRVLNTMREYSAIMKNHRAVMEEKLENWIGHDSELENHMMYSIRGGKCTRSLLSVLMGKHYGIDMEILDPLLISTELSQSASLIFDDLPAQDDAQTRRGVECLHIVHPEYVAQMTGLAMVMESYRTLTYLPIDDAKKSAVMRMVTECAGKNGLCKGQLIDLEESIRTIDEFKEMYWLKTGIAFYVPLAGVSIIAGKEEDLPTVREIAYNLGVAYQIRDDLMEESQSPSKKANRTATRIVDISYEKSLREFYKARQAVLDGIIKLGMTHAMSYLLGLVCKVLVIDTDTDDIYNSDTAMKRYYLSISREY